MIPIIIVTNVMNCFNPLDFFKGNSIPKNQIYILKKNPGNYAVSFNIDFLRLPRLLTTVIQKMITVIHLIV